MSESPTLSDIAKATGVSTSTVSRALKDSPKIPESTRKRIQSVAKEMGYEANRSISRVMSEIRSRKELEYRETLAYVTADPKGYEAHIYEGVLRRAEQIGYRVDRFVLKDVDQETAALDRMLRARGIRGVIVAPFGIPNAELQLAWEHFAAVTIGYTMSSPDLHRVGRDVVHMLRMVFSELTSRGYQRIGFMIEKTHEARMDYSTLAGYLVHEWQLSGSKQVQALVDEHLTADSIVNWYEREKPDVVFTMDHNARSWLEKAGYRCPEDFGFFVFNCYNRDSTVSGVYPEYENLGAAAVEQVSGLLERGEFGVPTAPRCLLVPGLWCEGQTIHRT
ncbi:MAG: hypothetical protein CML13_16595 [Puniceicoccaceae bacterium]|nr:hypothetical protein [Puniceicoccaceae bacterium]|tara:strand:- start:146 stop:1147 length:1002 start_codon:yes stop_codon:yes gene_type:complete